MHFCPALCPASGLQSAPFQGDTIYAAAPEGLDVLDNVTAAVDWANDFIARAPG